MRRPFLLFAIVSILASSTACEILGGIEKRHGATGGAQPQGGGPQGGGPQGGGGSGGDPQGGGGGCGESGCPLWSETFGGDDFEQLSGSAVDSSGNVVLTGHLQSAFRFQGQAIPHVGGGDIFVAKLTASGTLDWFLTFGDAGDQSYENYGGAAVDGMDRIVVGGNFTGSVDFGGGAISASVAEGYVARLAPDGGHSATQSLGDGANPVRVRDVATTPNGTLSAACGLLRGDLQDIDGTVLASQSGAGQAETDAFVAAFDSQLDALWGRAFDAVAGEAFAAAVALSPDGAAVYVGGSTMDALVDTTIGTYGGGRDAWVAKLDAATGALQWMRIFGDGGAQWVRALAVDDQGRLVTVGDNTGLITIDATTVGSGSFIMRFDSDGGALDAVVQSGSSEAKGLDVDASGAIYFATTFSDQAVIDGHALTSQGGLDVGVVALDGDLSYRWSRTFGGGGDDLPNHGLDVAPDSDVVVAGNFFIDLTFDVQHLSAGASDVFVARLGQ